MKLNYYWLIFGLVGLFYLWRLFNKNAKVSSKAWDTLNTSAISDTSSSNREYFIWEARNSISRSEYRTRNILVGMILIIALVAYEGAYLPKKQYETFLNNEYAFVNGFTNGWNEYCDSIFSPEGRFSVSPTGNYYAGSYMYNKVVCTHPLDSLDVSSMYYSSDVSKVAGEMSYKDVEDSANSMGNRQAKDTLWKNFTYLCYGSNCITKNNA